MTQNEQITMSNELYEIHSGLDTAANLLWYIIDEHFETATAPASFALDYERIQTKLRAVSELLYQACLGVDFITGEETNITKGFKRNVAELLEQHKHIKGAPC